MSASPMPTDWNGKCLNMINYKDCSSSPFKRRVFVAANVKLEETCAHLPPSPKSPLGYPKCYSSEARNSSLDHYGYTESSSDEGEARPCSELGGDNRISADSYRKDSSRVSVSSSRARGSRNDDKFEKEIDESTTRNLALLTLEDKPSRVHLEKARFTRKQSAILPSLKPLEIPAEFAQMSGRARSAEPTSVGVPSRLKGNDRLRPGHARAQSTDCVPSNVPILHVRCPIWSSPADRSSIHAPSPSVERAPADPPDRANQWSPGLTSHHSHYNTPKEHHQSQPECSQSIKQETEGSIHALKYTYVPVARYAFTPVLSRPKGPIFSTPVLPMPIATSDASPTAPSNVSKPSHSRKSAQRSFLAYGLKEKGWKNLGSGFFKCPRDGMVLNGNRSAIRHEARDLQQRAICEYCGQELARRDSVLRHQKTTCKKARRSLTGGKCAMGRLGLKELR
ncbi:hypothetical protein DFH11DRAFT_1594002 [Phellopilus nigrolimitatus]|nr:hypothetical protein DFH11DRAFT_1594002 [Phellopilus nigrolimitatus]